MLISKRNIHLKFQPSIMNSSREVHFYPISLLDDGRTNRRNDGRTFFLPRTNHTTKKSFFIKTKTYFPDEKSFMTNLAAEAQV